MADILQRAWQAMPVPVRQLVKPWVVRVSPVARAMRDARDLERLEELDASLTIWKGLERAPAEIRKTAIERLTLKIGRRAMRNHEWAKAMEVFKYLLDEHPDDRRFRESLAQATAHADREARR